MVVSIAYDGRVRIGPQSEPEDMSKIKDVTEFMKNDVADMNRQAEEIHKMAMDVKNHFGLITGHAKSQLEEAQKDLMELQASMGMNTNFPPSDGGQNA